MEANRNLITIVRRRRREETLTVPCCTAGLTCTVQPAKNQPSMKSTQSLFAILVLCTCLATGAATVRNIATLGAKDDGATANTKIIQDAINACEPGDTVLIPAGTFLSGAIFLKSDMTLQIDGTLKGTTNLADYPMIPSRFEGFEMDCYASLVTLGKRDQKGPYNVTNVLITG